jgi:hypothetical protein
MVDILGRLQNHINSDVIRREGGVIYVRSLKERYVLRLLIVEVLAARADGYTEVVFDFRRLRNEIVYANIATPIAAFCDHLSAETGLRFRLERSPKSLEDKHVFLPIDAGFTDHRYNPLNKVWKFSSPEDVFFIVTMLIDDLRQRDLIDGTDALLSLEWSLNEVVDNVLQHSKTGVGYVMGQLHSNEKNVIFCVADAGQGIYNSLRTSKEFQPTDKIDAITLAMREGVTRSKKEHQGNGLWGLHRIIEFSTGNLAITSAGARIFIDSSGRVSKENGPLLSSTRQGGGTVVDFQINYGKPVRIEDALNGHRPESIKLLSSMDESGTVLNYPLAKKPAGYGTRKAGIRVRNEIMNLIHEAGSPLVVDFDKVAIISSSFADEVFGKIFKNLGPIEFMKWLTLKNMNPTVSALVDKAIAQRFMSVDDDEEEENLTK